MAADRPTCKEIWADTAKYLYVTSTSITVGNGTYRAYRMLEFRDVVPPTGKWIGAFKNTSNQEVDPFPDDPGSNHSLPPGERACFYLSHEKKTPFNNAIFTARFEKENGQKARIRGIVCDDGPDHGSNAVPEYKEAANQCHGRALQVSVPIEGGYAAFTLVGDSLTIPQLLATMTPKSVGGEALGLSVLELQKVLAAKGTWFPCSSNGCCRAF
jgi:hypothetical protein